MRKNLILNPYTDLMKLNLYRSQLNYIFQFENEVYIVEILHQRAEDLK